MNRIKFALLTLASTLLMLIATTSSVFACHAWYYQPKAPKSLLK